jgi:predicted dehydrogenase
MNRRRFLTAASLAGAASTGPLRAADAPAPFTVAVIGHTGRGGYGHGLDTMWLDLPGAHLVAVADADPKGLEAARVKLRLPRGFADYRAMLDEVKPDLVSIGPRSIDQHQEMLLASIAAGAKGIYVEKPFVRDLREADEVVAASRESGTKIAIAHRNRYHPVLPVLSRLVADGAIGRLLEFRARGKEDTRGGALDLWVLGSHLCNLIHFFGGAPLACSATVLQDGKPITRADVKDGAEGIGPLAGNAVHARFDLPGGVPAFFDSVQDAGVKSTGFGLQLVGTEGVIDLRVDAEPVAHLRPGSPFRPDAGARPWQPVTTAGIGRPEPLADIRQLVGGHRLPALDLMAAIRENRAPLCDVEQASMTIEMISAVFESHRLEGKRVALPLTTRVNPLTLL